MNIGDKVPEFQAKNQLGECIKLSDYQKQKIILFFYPKASTSGCTNEVCNLRDGYTQLKAKGYHLLGVSTDSVKRQLNFQQKNELPFPLLADTEKEIVNLFGVWAMKKFMGREYMGVLRKTFVINEEGIITHIIDKVKINDHTNQLLDIL